MASPFDDIFGGSGPQWTTDQITARIRGEAKAQGVDPDLAVAVATQESDLSPDAKGDRGKSIGLFQLQDAAAKDAGIDPRWRDDPGLNIYGGVRYLKLKLDQSKGNVDEALSRYNRGTPDYRGIGDPNYVQNVKRFLPTPQQAPRQQPGMMARVASVFSPASAEAATPAQAQTAVNPVWDDIFGSQQPAQATSAPAQAQTAVNPVWDDIFGSQQPAQATSAPAQAQTPATSHVAPPGAQGAPSPRLSLGDPTEAASEAEAAATIAAMRARQAQAPPGSPAPVSPQPAPPSADVVADVVEGGPLATFGGGGRTSQAGAPALVSRGWREGDPIPPAHKPSVLPSQGEAPLEERLTTPSTLIPLLMGGAGVKAATRAMGEVAPWVGRFVRPVAEGLSQTLGFGTGRVAETGQLPSPGELATELAVTTATGRVLEDIGAVGADFLRRSKGGKAILAADEATQAARAKWQAEVDAAEGAAQSQQKEVYDTGVIKARAAQREYEMAARARREKIAANQTEYDQAVRAEQESRYAQRRQEIGEQQADYQAKDLARTHEMARRQQEYTGAIAGQEQAITQARSIPGRYAPETPSWVLYEKYGDAAKDAVVDLAPAKTALSELRAQHGVLPDGTVRPFPKPVEDVASKLEKASGDTPFETIRQELRKLGPLTRSADGNVRGPAKQLMGIYADVLDAAPIANDALKTANATFRREMAVRDMDDWLKPGHGVVARDRYGREKINVPALFKKIDKTMADESLFRGSFTPEERAALEADIGKLAGTPTMPTKPPGTPAITPVPQPELLPGSAAQVRQGLQTPPREPGPVALPGDVRVAQVPAPAATAAPVATTPGEQLGPRPPVAAKATSLGLMLVAAHELGVPFAVTSKLAVANAVLVGGQQARWLMAHALLDPSRRTLMQAAIDGQGILNPRFYGFMLATLSPAESKAYERETGAKR